MPEILFANPRNLAFRNVIWAGIRPWLSSFWSFFSTYLCALVCQGDRLVVWSHSLWTACAENLQNFQTFVIQESSSRASAKLWQRRWLTHAHTLACAEWRQAGQHRWARCGRRVDVLWGKSSALYFIFLLFILLRFFCFISSPIHSSLFYSSYLLLIPFLFISFLVSPLFLSPPLCILFTPLHSFQLLSSPLSSSPLLSSFFLSPPLLFLPLLSSPLQCDLVLSCSISLCFCVDLFQFCVDFLPLTLSGKAFICIHPYSVYYKAYTMVCSLEWLFVSTVKMK